VTVAAAALTDLYLQVAARIDGARLVREALSRDARDLRDARVLAVGKVAAPMFAGLAEAVTGAFAEALLIAPEGAPDEAADVSGAARVRRLVSDHPHPTPRSVAAARAARDFVARCGPRDRLVVLLSGGGSALMAEPASPLTLQQKRATVTAVARAGATIAELNTVRKHLSAVKGGRLALAAPVPTTVLALSDVVGDDPATIASGPFSPDPTTFAEALELVRRLAPEAPPAARVHLERGAAGVKPETPKPGDPRLAHVTYQVVAGPARVAEEARRQAEALGHAAAVLVANTEEAVPALAATYAERARRALAEPGAGPARVAILVGNGEPRIVVTGDGRGGRSTHLALLLARELAGLAGVSFLAAGTDREDGSSGASGAVVDGTTWPRALAAGLDPAAALERCDSASVLDRLGALVRGPGRSNLLDLHLLAVAPAGVSSRTP
jgi:hydroxypyruvate reductase